MKKIYTIYGLNGFNALISANEYHIHDILIEKNSYADKHIKSLNIAQHLNKKISFISTHELKQKYNNKRTQGIIINFTGPIIKTLPSFIETSKNFGLLILDQIEDPQNLGQIIRTSECAGIDGIILGRNNSCGINNTVIQVSQGAFFTIPIYEVSNINQCLAILKKENFWITAIENGINAKLWNEIDYSGKTAIILGSEGKGIKKINLKNSDFQASIPMQGQINSLNVSAAVSAVLFERLRQINFKK